MRTFRRIMAVFMAAAVFFSTIGISSNMVTEVKAAKAAVKNSEGKFLWRIFPVLELEITVWEILKREIPKL